MNWTDVIAILLGTGIITTLSQIFLTNKLNKQFFRYSNLYKDNLEIIRELYKLLIKAERALNILMSSREPELKVDKEGDLDKESESKREEFRKKTTDVIRSLFDFYEENEIVFDDDIVILFNLIKMKFEKAEIIHNKATIMESTRPSEHWENAVQAKQDAYDSIVLKDIPYLKNKLKSISQKRYTQLKTN